MKPSIGALCYLGAFTILAVGGNWQAGMVFLFFAGIFAGIAIRGWWVNAQSAGSQR